MSVGINPSKIYTHPVMGSALGKWVPLLTSASNFYWHVKKTSPAFADWSPKFAVFQAKRKAGEYRQADLSGGAREALANVLLSLAPVANPSQWLQDQLDAYAKSGAVFRGNDPRFSLADWTLEGSTPVASGGGYAGASPGASEGGGISSTAIGIGLLALAGGLWAYKRRR